MTISAYAGNAAGARPFARVKAKAREGSNSVRMRLPVTGPVTLVLSASADRGRRAGARWRLRVLAR